MSGKAIGTAVEAGRTQRVNIPPVDPDKQAVVDRVNELNRQGYQALRDAGVLTDDMPVARVQLIHISRVQANDYNPNAVAADEMRLLHTSISEDGYTMPIVAIWDDEVDKAIIVDGFHRYTTMRMFQDIADRNGGYLPVSIIEKSIEDRIASTVRHNRARGKHSVAGMGTLVFQMLEAGEDDKTICEKIGVDPEELMRLKHITGYSKLYGGENAKPYSKVVLTGSQMAAKAAFKKEHPDESVAPY
ncbi:ParB-like nuclease domain protein [Microbacterium phage Dewdrop]|nr:ParB-like nuclease domain protein [Microbacterium phage Leaf]QGZ17370.1 ParB-like nuclease domain protein [Microbacterium phage Dewdrop]